MDDRDLKHGVASTYNNHRCRCRDCKTAWAKYMRPRIKERRRLEKLFKAGQKKKGIRVEL